MRKEYKKRRVMSLIRTIGCNIKVNLQQDCNEFVFNNADSGASVHNRKGTQTLAVQLLRILGFRGYPREPFYCSNHFNLDGYNSI